MNIEKAARYLKRINRLFSTLQEEADNPSAIELALMKTYLTELYDAFLAESDAAPTPQAVEPPVIKPVTSQAPAIALQPSPRPEPTPAPKAEPTPKPAPPAPVAQPQPEPVVQAPPKPAPQPAATPPPPPPKPIEVVAPQPKPQPTPQPQPAAPSPRPKPAVDLGEYAELFEEEPSSNDLQQKLIQSKKVSDLRMAMGMNERFLIQNELFAGNADVFNAALDHLNQLSSMEEAQAYLVREFAATYEWLDERRQKKVKRFVSIVRRRYH